ncbi:transcription antitermination factor NusB [Candidatus Peregrinibacteria bacterium]|nr:transcription antitermination factor NusB [Candidatus Peregrinibacteria bacterium]
MAQYRRLCRIAAMQTLTALLLRGESDEGKAKTCFLQVKEDFAPELGNKDEFSREIMNGVLKNREGLDQQIYELAPEWPIEKLSTVERVILEAGAFELLQYADTPLAVIINEWVDIAKEFGDETAGKFINGVLSNLAHQSRKEGRGTPPSKKNLSSEAK